MQANLGKRSSSQANLPERNASGESVLEITPLGAGNEVGRSCVLLKFKGKTVLLDCGVHPAYSGIASLPYFDLIDDFASIDLLLVSQYEKIKFLFSFVTHLISLRPSVPPPQFPFGSCRRASLFHAEDRI